jgi:hypothetical protein
LKDELVIYNQVSEGVTGEISSIALKHKGRKEWQKMRLRRQINR